MTAQKDIRGNWHLSEDIPLQGAGNRVLRLSTHKTSSGQLVTSATVGTVDRGMFSYMMYTDFNKRVMATRPARITGKVVDAQHASAKECYLDALLLEIAAHYPGEMVPVNENA